jgi:predicted nucleic acid-binding protein
MVLVDTSVWAHHFRTSDVRLISLLNNYEVMIHPFIIGELACGNLRNRREILSLLHSLPSTTVLDTDDVLFFIEKNYLMGKGVGLIDVHLLAAAKLKNISLWTNDKKLGKMAEKLNLAYPYH